MNLASIADSSRNAEPGLAAVQPGPEERPQPQNPEFGLYGPNDGKNPIFDRSLSYAQRRGLAISTLTERITADHAAAQSLPTGATKETILRQVISNLRILTNLQKIGEQELKQLDIESDISTLQRCDKRAQQNAPKIIATCRSLAGVADERALKALEETLDQSKDPEVLVAALTSLKFVVTDAMRERFLNKFRGQEHESVLNALASLYHGTQSQTVVDGLKQLFTQTYFVHPTGDRFLKGPHPAHETRVAALDAASHSPRAMIEPALINVVIYEVCNPSSLRERALEMLRSEKISNDGFRKLIGEGLFLSHRAGRDAALDLIDHVRRTQPDIKLGGNLISVTIGEYFYPTFVRLAKFLAKWDDARTVRKAIRKLSSPHLNSRLRAISTLKTFNSPKAKAALAHHAKTGPEDSRRSAADNP